MKNRFDVLTDDELEASLQLLAKNEKRHLVDMLLHLQVVDARRLPQRRAFPSLFEYCASRLRWAEGETAKRLRRSLLTLSTAALVAPHLSRKNCATLLRSIYGRRTREVECIVAAFAPTPEPRERVRFLGAVAPSVSTEEPAPSASDATQPTEQPELPVLSGPQRVLFSFHGSLLLG